MHRNLLLHDHSFRSFWITRMCSTMANQMTMLAVGYQMYDLTHSAWNLGLVGLMQFTPALLLNLLVGQVVDRLDRRRILACCYATQILVISALVWTSMAGTINRDHILAAAIALGIAKAFQMPTQQAMPALLVPREILPQALALNSVGMKFAVILGPATAGFIYISGAHVVYGLCGILLACALGFLSRVRYALEQIRSTDPVNWQTLFAGINFIWRNKILLGANSLDLFATLLGGATALLPVYARDILHTGPWGLGILRAGPAMGAFCMSLWLARRPVQHHAGRTMFIAVACYGVFIMLFGVSTHIMPALLMLAGSGAADMLSTVIRQSLVQLNTPDEMRGRVSAVNAMFIGASNQLGEFESGTAAALFGSVEAVVLGGLGSIAIALLWMRLFPVLAHRNKLINEPDGVLE